MWGCAPLTHAAATGKLGDHQPSWCAWAKTHLNVTETQIEAKAAKFRGHHLAGGKRAADWDLEFRDWLAADFDEKKQQQQFASGAQPLELQRSWLEALKLLGPAAWPKAAGPLPGEPDCFINPGLLVEYGLSNGRAALMRLLYTEMREWMTYRKYWHPVRGIVHTSALTIEPNVIIVWGPNFGAGERPPPPWCGRMVARHNVIYIRPGFGGPMPPSEVARFETRTSNSRSKRKKVV